MLTCKELAEHASDYLDDNMSPTRQLSLRMHLLLCRHCRDYMDQLALTIQGLRAAAVDEEPVEVSAALVQRFVGLPNTTNNGEQ